MIAQINGETADMDFAILELVTDLEFNDTIRPACLPDFTFRQYIEEKAGNGVLS